MLPRVMSQSQVPTTHDASSAARKRSTGSLKSSMALTNLPDRCPIEARSLKLTYVKLIGGEPVVTYFDEKKTHYTDAVLPRD